MTARRVRPAALAGQWYPGSPDALARAVDDYLAQAQAMPPAGPPLGLLSPHAGYSYSGPTAGWAFRQVMAHRYDTVVIVALCHGRSADSNAPIRLSTTSIYDGDAFQTPLGELPIDRDIVHALRRDAPDLFPFVEAAHRLEHSIELQLPFIQRALGTTPIVPILIQNPGQDVVEAVAAALAKALANRSALVVASSDLSHRPPAGIAERIDRQALEAVAAGDAAALRARLAKLERTPAPNLMCAMCGAGATMVMMDTVRRLGPARGHVLHYSNSSDGGAPTDAVVGYGAVAFTPASWS